MSDDTPKYVDLSELLSAQSPVDPEDVKSFVASLPSKSYTLTGTWDSRPVCGVCHERFTTEFDDQVAIISDDTGFAVQACPACTKAVMG